MMGREEYCKSALAWLHAEKAVIDEVNADSDVLPFQLMEPPSACYTSAMIA